MSRFTGQHIWLIGASAGIGESLALQLAQEGATLAISARSEDKLDELKARMHGDGHVALGVDVTDLASIASAWGRLSKDWPRVDMVIFLAGIYEPMGIDNFDLDMIERTININLIGAYRLLDCILPGMRKQAGGKIVLTASVAGYRGLPKSFAYGESKAALIQLAETLHIELVNSGVGVQLISPGFVRTRLTDKNRFDMPMIITPERAAQYIADGLAGNAFEIHFPKRFTLMLKFMQLLPRRVYFALINQFL